MDRKPESYKEYSFKLVQGRENLHGQIKFTLDNLVQKNTSQINFVQGRINFVHGSTLERLLAWTKPSSSKPRFFGLKSALKSPRFAPRNPTRKPGIKRHQNQSRAHQFFEPGHRRITHLDRKP
jgi:hypothetical protein